MCHDIFAVFEKTNKKVTQEKLLADTASFLVRRMGVCDQDQGTRARPVTVSVMLKS